MNKAMWQSGTAMPNKEAEFLSSENDFSLQGSVSSKSMMRYCLRRRRVFPSGEKFQELDIGNEDINRESNTQDGSVPDDNQFETLYEDDNDITNMNEEYGCFDLV